MDSQKTIWQDTWFKWSAVVLLILLAIFTLTKTASEFNWIGDNPPMNTVTVSGSGEAYAVPDVAILSFTITAETMSVGESQGTASEKSQKAYDYLRNQGIEEKDIKTTNYSVRPRYEFERVECTTFPCVPSKRVLAGYEVSESFSVKVRDTAKAGEILSGLGDLGVTNISGPNFQIDDQESFKAEARSNAIAEAKAKAEKLAEDLGVKLVKIVSFYETDFGTARFYDGLGGLETFEAKIDPVITPGEDMITSTVNITYEIR